MSFLSLPKDDLTSLFQDNEDDITVFDIQGVIENRISKQNNNWKAYIPSLNYCYEALNILSDLIKLQILYNKSNEFISLNNIINNIFNHDLNIDTFDTHILQVDSIKDLFNDSSYQQWSHKDIALRAVQKCNKLLFELDTLTKSLADIRVFIGNNMDDLPRDSMTLLTEVWFYLISKLNWFKLQIIFTFVKSKCVLINFELTLILNYISHSDLYENDLQFKSDVMDRLRRTIISFDGLISDLLKNIDRSIKNKDETLYNESFKSFLDIETMYNHTNFRWLIPEETPNEEPDPLFIDDGSFNPYLNSDLRNVKQLKHVSKYVNNMFDLIPGTEAEIELEGLSHSPIGGAMLHSMKEQQRQANPHPTQTKHTMDCSASSFGYITHQLPNLLNAFSNVKQLEYDIETSPNLLSRDERDKINISGGSFIKRELNLVRKERSQSISSSLSTSSTLFSNTGSPSLPPIRSPYNDNFCATKTYNTDNFNNIENININSNGKTINSSRRYSAKFLSKGLGLYFSNPLLASINSSSIPSTSIVNKSQIWKNDFQMLTLMDENFSFINNKISSDRIKFANSMLNHTTSNISGFHSTLLNNIYGINGVKSSRDIRSKLKSPV